VNDAVDKYVQTRSKSQGLGFVLTLLLGPLGLLLQQLGCRPYSMRHSDRVCGVNNRSSHMLDTRDSHWVRRCEQPQRKGKSSSCLRHSRVKTIKLNNET